MPTTPRNDQPAAADLLREHGAVTPRPEPVDADWPAREADAEEADDKLGDPADVRDEGVLESLGKAVTDPIQQAADDDDDDAGQAGRP